MTGRAVAYAKSFKKSGHRPTLYSAFLYSDLAFMVWVMLGPLGVLISADLRLTHEQQGLMVSAPVLSGAVLRLLMGVMVDHIGPKAAGAIGQVIVMIALFVTWIIGIHEFRHTLLLGLFLGVGGASFAVALPLVSRWYPAEHQGRALGLAAAGHSGTATSVLVIPFLASVYGWQSIFGIILIPLALVFVVYMLFAKDSPDCPPPKQLTEYLKVLRDKDAWWFMFFYLVTFGGYIGLTSSLSIYFNVQYGLGAKTAGVLTALCVFAGSSARPLGGGLADRIGGIRTLTIMYSIAAASILISSFAISNIWIVLVVFMVAMAALGMGNGAVFQLVPQRFRKEIGVMTGLVGMAGALGGFYLAFSLGLVRQITGDYRWGFLVFAALALLALAGLSGVKNRWRTTWGASHLTRAKI